MRIFAQDRAFHRGVRVDLGGRPEADRRFKLLRRVERTHGHGLTLAAAPALLGLPRSTATRPPRCSSCSPISWAFHAGERVDDAEVLLTKGDAISIPNQMFSGFTNVGEGVGFMFAVLGEGDPGCVP